MNELDGRIYLDDFAAGQVFELGSRSVSKEEMIDFATKYDPQPFHVDESAGQSSIYGGLIASGWLTVAILMRLLVDGLLSRTASMGSPGVDEVRWLAPVRPGDTLTGRGVVHEVIPSRSKPDRGIIRTTYEMYNQNGERVLAIKGIGMFARRPRKRAGDPAQRVPGGPSDSSRGRKTSS